jgi:hypothetical protein
MQRSVLLVSLTMLLLLVTPARLQFQPFPPYRSVQDASARLPGIAVRYYTLSGSPTQVPGCVVAAMWLSIRLQPCILRYT